MTLPRRPPAKHAGRSDHAEAFLPDPEGGPARVLDDLAEELAEEFVLAATSGAYVSEEERDREVPEESGGPFVVHSARQEFARDIDRSNPLDASREPLPAPMRGQ